MDKFSSVIGRKFVLKKMMHLWIHSRVECSKNWYFFSHIWDISKNFVYFRLAQILSFLDLMRLEFQWINLMQCECISSSYSIVLSNLDKNGQLMVTEGTYTRDEKSNKQHTLCHGTRAPDSHGQCDMWHSRM